MRKVEKKERSDRITWLRLAEIWHCTPSQAKKESIVDARLALVLKQEDIKRLKSKQ